MEVYDLVHKPIKLMMGLCMIYKKQVSYIPPKIRIVRKRDLQARLRKIPGLVK